MLYEKNNNYKSTYYDGTEKNISFIPLPTMLMDNTAFDDISSDGKLLYAYLLNELNFSLKKGFIDATGRLYTEKTLRSMERIIHRKEDTVRAALKNLAKHGLIEQKRVGNSKPNKIYINNFSTKEPVTPSTLGKFAFIKIPRIIIENPAFSALRSADILQYACLYNRMSLSHKNGWTDENNRTFVKCSLASIQKRFNCKTAMAISINPGFSD